MRGWLGVVVAPVAAIGSLALACSLTTSLDGYSSGAGPAPDAAPDAPIDSGPPFCASHADAGVFCADFDDGGIPGSFGDVSQAGTGKLSVGSEGSLVADVGTGSGSASACLSRSFGGTRGSITVELDAQVEATGAADFDIFGLYKDTDHNLTIQVVGGNVQFDEDVVPDGGPDQIITPTSTSVDAAFHHYRLTVTLGVSTADAQLFVDGKLAGTYVANLLDFGPPFELLVGDCELPASGSPWRVRIDNVLFY
jgi:hypothetical protein